MKTYLFLMMMSVVYGCGGEKKDLDSRFMIIGKYVAENCRDSYLYDSLPAHYIRAMEMGRDSAERLVVRLEGYVNRNQCPE